MSCQNCNRYSDYLKWLLLFLTHQKSEKFIEILKKRKVLATGLKVFIQNRTLLPFEIGFFFQFLSKGMDWVDFGEG